MLLRLRSLCSCRHFGEVKNKVPGATFWHNILGYSCFFLSMSSSDLSSLFINLKFIVQTKKIYLIYRAEKVKSTPAKSILAKKKIPNFKWYQSVSGKTQPLKDVTWSLTLNEVAWDKKKTFSIICNIKIVKKKMCCQDGSDNKVPALCHWALPT